jgi:hypothetical protein
MADLEKKLATARALQRSGNYDDPVFGELANANCQPALLLFEEMLDDSRDEARYMTLGLLAQMEGLEANERILKKVRQILLDDPDDLSRGEAARILGSNSKWPDSALERAIAVEEHPPAQQAIFLAILRLLTSWDFADKMRSDVRKGKVELSLESALALAGAEAAPSAKAKPATKATKLAKKTAKPATKKRSGPSK